MQWLAATATQSENITQKIFQNIKIGEKNQIFVSYMAKSDQRHVSHKWHIGMDHMPTTDPWSVAKGLNLGDS